MSLEALTFDSFVNKIDDVELYILHETFKLYSIMKRRAVKRKVNHVTSNINKKRIVAARISLGTDKQPVRY